MTPTGGCDDVANVLTLDVATTADVGIAGTIVSELTGAVEIGAKVPGDIVRIAPSGLVKVMLPTWPIIPAGETALPVAGMAVEACTPDASSFAAEYAFISLEFSTCKAFDLAPGSLCQRHELGDQRPSYKCHSGQPEDAVSRPGDRRRGHRAC